ncbi:hypothetical protein N752_27635 [Desulforamulus aquiferis]|nr:hypothetical protein N752_27635 [Desulforamulus aquiferis]
MHGGPLSALKGLLGRYNTPQLPDLPRFTGGAAGYFGYDLIRYLERLPNYKPDDLGLPVCQLMFPGLVLAFDHIRRTLLIIANIPLAGSPEETYELAIKKLNVWLTRYFLPPIKVTRC